MILMRDTTRDPREGQMAGETRSYSAAVSGELLDDQGRLMDWLIDFAFDTLRADHLEVRVMPAPPLEREVNR